jgi:tetratricopeptide (TPR) repeat protein
VTPRFRASCFALVTQALVATALAAAPITVALRVQGAAAAPVAGAAVEIAAAPGEEAFTLSGTTDSAGLYLADLPDNRRPYVLKVTAAGHQPFEAPLELKGKRGNRNKPYEVPVPIVAFTAADHFNAGVAELREKKLDAAATSFRRAVELEPSLSRGWSVLAMIELENGKPAEALEHAERAVALDVADMNALRTRYEALAALGRAADADAALTALYEKDKTPDTARLLFNAGAEAANGGKSEAARLRLGQALELDPKLWQAHTALAELAIREERLPDAVAALDRAIEISPRNFKAWERKVEVLRAMGKAEEADAAAARLAELKGAG